MRSPLSYANVTATLALVVALSGSSYAAVTLAKNSVGAKQLKNNAVVAAKVKDGSLLGADFAAGQLPAGAAGPTGPAGPVGPVGPAGPLLTSLPSGRTLTGAWGGSFTTNVASQLFSTPISYPFPVVGEVQQEVVSVGGTPTAGCPGSAAAPRAAAGRLCIYTGFRSNTANLFAYGSDGVGDFARGGVVYWQSVTTGRSETAGTWAVTAP